MAEQIALIQFNDFLTKQDKLTQHQTGNRKNPSMEALSLLVTDHIFRAVDQQQLTAMVLNYRPQQGLRRYLPQYTSQTTQPRHIKLGSDMVQELPHGPQAVYSIRHLSIWWAYDNTWRASRLHLRLLFNLYTNDLPSAVKSSCTDSYVDDTKIYCSFSAKNMNSCLVKVTEDLCLIGWWCCSHQLLINPSKTKLILFGTRQLLIKVSDTKNSLRSPQFKT